MNRTPLLLLPGTLNNATLWQAQVGDLSPHGDIVIADLTRQDNTAAMADDALALMPPGPFAMAGFSLGGYVALEVMRRAGERVAALGLVNTSARPEAPEGRPGREKMMALAGRDFARLTGSLIQFMLAPQSLADTALVASIQAMMDDVGAEAFVRQSQAVMGRADSRDLLASIHCPTLVIAGADDKVAPPRLGEEMAHAISGAKLHVLPATGHLSPMEQPAQVAALMQAWLASAAQAA